VERTRAARSSDRGLDRGATIVRHQDGVQLGDRLDERGRPRERGAKISSSKTASTSSRESHSRTTVPLSSGQCSHRRRQIARGSVGEQRRSLAMTATRVRLPPRRQAHRAAVAEVSQRLDPLRPDSGDQAITNSCCDRRCRRRTAPTQLCSGRCRRAGRPRSAARRNCAIAARPTAGRCRRRRRRRACARRD